MQRGVMMSVKVAIMLVIIVAGFTPAVLFLWNWLMPTLFGLHTITFWQSLGLIGLSWILFRGPMFGGRDFGSGGGMRRRWAAMTPEQREQFRRGMQTRCGGAPRPPAEAAPGA